MNLMHGFHSRHRHPSQKAFTLIEILMVLVILTALIVMMAPALLGLMKSTRLSSAGDEVVNHLVDAQLIALSEFTDVEVRLYELPDFSEADSSPQLRGLQTYALRFDQNNVDSDGSFQAATPIVHLDHGVAISRDQRLSSLINLKWSEDKGPDGQSQRRYFAFRFHSDGSTDLTPDQQWFLTLAEQQAPANYYTIQIDPETGRVRTFRP